MNQELKAISLLHPHILDGDGKLTSGFIEEPDEIKTDLLSNISGVELFLRNADYANNIFNEYDYHSSDDLLEVFKLTSKSLLENLDIIKMAAVSNPVFLEAISKELFGTLICGILDDAPNFNNTSYRKTLASCNNVWSIVSSISFHVFTYACL